MTFDPRQIGKCVYEELKDLRSHYDAALNDPKNTLTRDIYDKHLKEQKNQSVELYSYVSTWGLMRLRAEEISLDKWGNITPNIFQRAAKNQEGKREAIERYFICLQNISGTNNLSNGSGLDTLKKMDVNEYLGLTGLGLAVAEEFSFWASAVYHDIKGED